MNLSNSQKGFAPVSILIFIVVILMITGGGYYLFQQKTLQPITVIPESVVSLANQENLEFEDGNVKLTFSNNKNLVVKKISSDNYSIDYDPQGIYTVVYFSSKVNFLQTVVTSKDSNGDEAGQGCVYKQDSVVDINNYSFTETICYYNPVTITNSGEYNPSSSSVTKTACVYQVSNKGILYFDGQVPLETNICDFVKNNLQDLNIITSEFVNKDFLVGIWQDMPSLGSGWSDRYQFYTSGKYAHISSQMNCQSRNLGEIGNWELEGKTLTLKLKKKITLVGGKLVDSTGSCSSKQMIEDGKEEVQDISDSQVVVIELREKTEEEVYPSLKFNNKTYWHFNNELKDEPPFEYLDLSGCGSEQDPCF